MPNFLSYVVCVASGLLAQNETKQVAEALKQTEPFAFRPLVLPCLVLTQPRATLAIHCF